MNIISKVLLGFAGTALAGWVTLIDSNVRKNEVEQATTKNEIQHIKESVDDLKKGQEKTQEKQEVMNMKQDDINNKLSVLIAMSERDKSSIPNR